jgi:hypothetical protein
MASMLTRPNIDQDIKNIDPWYFEAVRFRTALLLSSKHFKDEIAELKQHVNTDPLTGLYNRRGMKLFLNELEATNTPFSVLTLDIDHFKAVNDVSFKIKKGKTAPKKSSSILLFEENFKSKEITLFPIVNIKTMITTAETNVFNKTSPIDKVSFVKNVIKSNIGITAKS